MSRDESLAPPAWDPARHPLDTDEQEGGWLPTGRQLFDAFVLRMSRAIGPDPAGVPFYRGLHTSMRQGLGLITVLGLLIGLPALLIGLFTGLPFPQYLPFRWLGSIPGLEYLFARSNALLSAASSAPTTPAAYDSLPRMTASLWALGAWLTLPVRLITLWLVGGLIVMVIARLLGAHNTLARFYSATAFAFLPFILLLLTPMQSIGAAVTIVALIFFAVAYAAAVHVAMATDWGHTLVTLLAAVLGTGLLLALLGGAALIFA